MMAAFFGGDDSSFASKKEEHLYLDDFMITTQPVASKQ